jgi:hypothetical protein
VRAEENRFQLRIGGAAKSVFILAVVLGAAILAIESGSKTKGGVPVPVPMETTIDHIRQVSGPLLGLAGIAVLVRNLSTEGAAWAVTSLLLVLLALGFCARVGINFAPVGG